MLIELAKQGDSAAFGELVDRYKHALVRHCYMLVGDPDIAQDVAQDTFIDAYKYLGSYQNNKARFSTWLYKIATHNGIRMIQSGKKTIPMDNEALGRLPSGHISPDVAVEHYELRQAVLRMPPNYRAVISMYYWEGMAYSEIAMALGKPEGTVKGWLSRAKYQLRKEIS